MIFMKEEIKIGNEFSKRLDALRVHLNYLDSLPDRRWDDGKR
jgi:hypothetical protein